MLWILAIIAYVGLILGVSHFFSEVKKGESNLWKK